MSFTGNWRPEIRKHGRFRNALGEGFLANYDHIRKWHTTRDVRSFAIYNEVRKGRGSPHDGCYMDLTTVPSDVMDYEFSNSASSVRTRMISAYLIVQRGITKLPQQ